MPYQVTDWELKRLGEWTEADAAARRLIGAEWGALDYRPVRLGAVLRKGLSPVTALIGAAYDKRYHFNPDAHAYVLLRRGGPAVIVDEAWGAEVDTQDDAPPEAFADLRRELERDLQALQRGPRPALVSP